MATPEQIDAAIGVARRADSSQRATPPTWCEPKDWSRMIDSVQAWIATYGDLRRWSELRHMKASEL